MASKHKKHKKSKKPQIAALFKEAPVNLNAYNKGDVPTIVVKICDTSPDRGDSHGPLGIAARIAEKTGGTVEVLDKLRLEQLYPELEANLRLKNHFNVRGYPDFAFGVDRYESGITQDPHLRSRTLFVTMINESIANALEVKKPFYELCPHHLTPKELEYEGNRFATEYAELPRPFFGVVIADPYMGRSIEKAAKKLARQHWFHGQGTFFIVSCHRTEDSRYDKFVGILKDHLPERKKDKFPVIEFNYRQKQRDFGMETLWNPYKGLINQADHLVLLGSSHSMLSEMLMSGRRVFNAGVDLDRPAYKGGFLKKIFTSFSMWRLQSPAITPPDLTAACADKMIGKYKAMTEPGYSNLYR